ncbi:MAG: cysteine desulfurase [Bacilli bacterium]|nr:cysteine desulfurase [Bacilli bacterium]
MKINNSKLIYLDNASTTKVNEEVLKVYNDTNVVYFANPSSIHKEGQKSFYLLNRSKEEILRLLNLKDHEVIYLSGATEANNLAVKGVALRYKNRGDHLITTAYEHPSILEAYAQLEKEFGFKVTYLKPNKDGIITSQMVETAMTDKTILVSIMAVNNEIGAVNPIEDISKLLEKYPKAIFHVDACQAIGKLEKEINYSKVDLLTISGHKIHGLVGFGALIKKKKIELLPLNSGGGQEYGYRSGTEDLANANALVKAVQLALKDEKKNYNHVKEMADKLLSYLRNKPELYELNVPTVVNPYIINFSTISKKGSVVVEALSNNNIMVSSTSACHSSKEKGSYVVASLGKSEKAINNTIRVSLDSSNTMEEIDTFVSILDEIIGEIR